jgi:N-acetylated-alpha-linked acidic dipeptidase
VQMPAMNPKKMLLKVGLAVLGLAGGSNLLPITLAAAPDAAAPLLGFSEESAKQEREIEKKFDAELNKEEMAQWMEHMAAHPHHLGSKYGEELAGFVKSNFVAWGYTTEIKEYTVLFPTPKTRLLEMIRPEKFTASLREESPAQAQSTGLTEQLLPYNAYCIGGDVTSELVYVNYGVPKDYEVLEQRGIDVKGKIVIARYGGSWRGIKPKVAAEHGAIGCLIYSDPRDDGYFQGDVFPNGLWRNQNGAQRGSVEDMPLYPGDPFINGVIPTEEGKREAIKNATSLAKIPVLPISYADAQPLLAAMGGPVAPEEWRGALPLTYHLGPGPAAVHLKLELNWDFVKARDIVARMPGTDRADEWVVRGNHYDAWVNGAWDPLSGAVCMLEQARAFSVLKSKGWQPRRTIIFGAWDGEEPGLVGSTKWFEENAEELTKHAAIYINTDDSGRGFFQAGGSHTLERFINQIARDLTDPEKNIPVWERLRDRTLSKASRADRREINGRADLRMGAVGAGSDYVAALNHLGIPVVNLGYSGEDGGGSYHSIEDSYANYSRFMDPGFNYTLLLTQTSGRAVLRFANADMLPFEFNDFADTVEKYVGEVTKLLDEMREDTKETNQLIRSKMLWAEADPKEPFVEPLVKPDVPYLNFAPLQNSLAKLKESCQKFEAARKASEHNQPALTPATEQAVDQILLKMEHTLTTPEGLPRRPWYKHTIYAPGFYTGYSAKTLPGVREAIEERKWPEAGRQIEIVAGTLDAFANELDLARKLFPVQGISP